MDRKKLKYWVEMDEPSHEDSLPSLGSLVLITFLPSWEASRLDVKKNTFGLLTFRLLCFHWLQ